MQLEPARYRLVLRHPDGRTEAGAFRRYRSDAPRIGHSFSDDRRRRSRQLAGRGRPAAARRAGQAVPRADRRARLQRGRGAPDLPEHELEHALARDDDRDDAVAALARAEEAGQLVELVALEPGEAPDWDEAGRYIDALILEEIEDDLFELCGVDTRNDSQDTWLETVKARLHEDLRASARTSRATTTRSRSGISVTAACSPRSALRRPGDPDVGHGWLSRLVDSSASAAAGFTRVRKASLSFE